MCALAYVDFSQGNYRAARQLAEEGAALARQNGLARLAVLCLNHVGRCCLETNEMEAARMYFEQTAALAREIPFPQYEISANINLSLAAIHHGCFPEAEARLQKALVLAEEQEYRAFTGMIHLNLGTVCLHQGKYAAGQAHYQAAQREYQKSGNLANIGLSYHAQASVAQEMGDFAAARRYFAQALALYRETGAKHRQLVILSELSDVRRATGHYPAARQYLEEALALSEEIGENISRLNLRAQEVWLALETGDWAVAERGMAQIDGLLAGNPPVAYKLAAYLAQRRFWLFRERPSKARRYGEMAAQLARERDRRALPDCAVGLGYVLLALGEGEAARRLFAEALQIRLEREQAHLAAEARAGLARAALLAGDLAAAQEQVEAVLRFLDGPEPPNTLAGAQEPALVYLACYVH